MSPSVEQFARALSKIAPRLEADLLATFDYWKPELPPGTEVLGELGRSIAVHWSSIAMTEKEALSFAIERGVVSSDSELANSICTGLVEATLNSAARGADCTESDVLEFLGPESRAYAKGWLAFFDGAPQATSEK